MTLLSSTSPATDHTVDDLTRSDSQLVDAVRRGEWAAYEGLVNRYQIKALRVAQRLVHDRETARDLVQEAFLKTFQALDQFDPARRFGPWFIQIVVNLCLDELRREKRRVKPQPWDNTVQPAAQGASPAEELESQELARQVRQVIDQLPVNLRVPLVLRDLEGLSTSEIAAILDRREPTIRWRISQAREQFRQLWSEQQEPTP